MHLSQIVIVNAGVASPEAGLAEATKEGFVRDFETNAVGPVLVTRALDVRGLLGGVAGVSKVAVVSSVLGSAELVGSKYSHGAYGYYAYRASKASANILTRLLARDLWPKGVAVFPLHPGYVKTDMSGHNGNISPDQAAAGIKALLERDAAELNGKFYAANIFAGDWEKEIIPW